MSVYGDYSQRKSKNDKKSKRRVRVYKKGGKYRGMDLTKKNDWILIKIH